MNIEAAQGWALTAFGSKDTLAHEKVNSNKFGFLIALGNGEKKLTDNRNLILYGHHMSTSSLGSMFQSLDNYLDENFFRNNNEIKIYTLDGAYTYKVFSVYVTDKYYPYITTYFPDEDSFVSFAERIAANSVHKADFTVGAGDSILTLSTCNNRSEDGRLAVHAVLVKDSK